MQDTVDKIIEALDNEIYAGRFEYIHQKSYGIRSRQVVALIALLVEQGLLKLPTDGEASK